MELICKTVCLHGGRDIYILTPETISREITATDDKKGYFYILSNGTGYALLSKLYALAISLGNNELIHLPLDFAYREAYKKDFPELKNHYTGIVLFNYCTMQIDGKGILTALKKQTCKSGTRKQE